MVSFTFSQIYKFFWNLLLATSITSTVLANILQIWGKHQLNTSKNVFNTILEWMMYIYQPVTLLSFIIKCIFRFVFAGLAKPLKILGASHCSPKNMFQPRYCLAWTYLWSSNTNFYHITISGFNLDQSCCWYQHSLCFIYRWKMKQMKRSPLKKKTILLICIK